MCISTVSIITSRFTVLITHVTDVKRKIDDGYQVVKFDEVNGIGALRGRVMQALVDKKYYGDLKLDGGQVSFKRYCKGNSCESKKIAFEFESGQRIRNKLGVAPQYVAMIGNTLTRSRDFIFL